MATNQDCSIGIAQESTYKTGVTVSRWYEFIDESLDWDKSVKQGQGLRVGKRVARSARRTVPTAQGGGDITLELTSKALGLFLNAALGASTVTLVAGTTYQHNFTLGDTPPSLTVQKGVIRVDGTVDPYTFLGCMVDSWELNIPNGDIATLKLTLDAGDLATATAYAAPSYAAEPVNLFHFANASISTGTFTAPTTTALASAASPLASVRSLTLSCNNNLADDRYNMGGAGRKDKPTVGLREIAGSAVIEYANTTFRDAVLNETPMALVANLTAGALSTGVETFNIALPEVKFDKELAKANKTDLVLQSMAFSVLDNLTAAQPIWISTRTSDSAL